MLRFVQHCLVLLQLFYVDLDLLMNIGVELFSFYYYIRKFKIENTYSLRDADIAILA